MLITAQSLRMHTELILVQMTHEAWLRSTLTCYTSPGREPCQHPESLTRTFLSLESRIKLDCPLCIDPMGVLLIIRSHPADDCSIIFWCNLVLIEFKIAVQWWLTASVRCVLPLLLHRLTSNDGISAWWNRSQVPSLSLMSLIKGLVCHFLHISNARDLLARYWCSPDINRCTPGTSLFNYLNEYSYFPTAHLVSGIREQFPIIHSVCIPLTHCLLVSVARQRPPEPCGPHIHFMPRGCQEHNW